MSVVRSQGNIKFFGRLAGAGWIFFILFWFSGIAFQLVNAPEESRSDLGLWRDFLCWERSWNDFVVHVRFSQIVKEHQIDRPFTPEGQLQIHSYWLNEPRSSGMPSGYFPSYYWIIGKLGLSVKVLFVAWTMVTAFVWMMLVGRIREVVGPIKAFWCSAIVLLSSLGFSAVVFGQISLMAAALLVLLQFPTSWMKRFSVLITSLILLVLVTKPPLAFLGWGILVLRKRYRELVFSLILPFLLFISFCQSHGGFQTAIDYVKWISSYNYVLVGPAFENAIHPLFQSNALSWMLQMKVVSRDDVLFWNRFLLLIFAVFTCIFLRKSSHKLEIGLSFCGWMYLLFSPQLSITEDLIGFWIVVQAMCRFPFLSSVFVLWLGLLLNCHQTTNWLFSGFLYQYPIPWMIKVAGFWGWVWCWGNEQRIGESSESTRIWKEINDSEKSKDEGKKDEGKKDEGKKDGAPTRTRT